MRAIPFWPAVGPAPLEGFYHGGLGEAEKTHGPEPGSPVAERATGVLFWPSGESITLGPVSRPCGSAGRVWSVGPFGGRGYAGARLEGSNWESTAVNDYRSTLARYGDTLWWPRGMRYISWALLGEWNGRLLDVGCGPGWDLAALPAGVSAVGLDRDGRHVAFAPFVLGDAGRLPFRDAAFDVVWTLDLLEQRGVDALQALRDIARVLRPGGQVLVRVPAHSWLYGPHDRLWGGARRYARSELAALVRDAGLSIRRLTYANCLLFPITATARLLARAGLVSGDDLRPVPTPFDRLLLGVLKIEARWLRRRDLPVGLSLLCLAEVPGS